MIKKGSMRNKLLKLIYAPRLQYHCWRMRRYRTRSHLPGTVERAAWHYHYYANGYLLKKWERALNRGIRNGDRERQSVKNEDRNASMVDPL